MNNVTDFAALILSELENVFGPDEVETLIRRDRPMGGDAPAVGNAVKVVHKPTGLTVVCDEYDSQIKNKAMALARLIAFVNKLALVSQGFFFLCEWIPGRL